jgi:hypothetical protein
MSSVMTPLALRLLGVAAGLALTSVPLAAELPIIAKARAYIGSEAALNGLKSVHYLGVLEAADPANPGRQTRASMDIIFQKPEQQWIKVTADNTAEITALDGYDGWQRVQDIADPAKWRQTLLGTEHIKRLRANTWQNLAFYRGIERVGGRIVDEGTTTLDGVTCTKVAFIHAPNIVFYRYFDVATGRLVHTETESGGTIREEGEMVVNGIRFPKRIVTATKNDAGQMQTVTITFEKITVNESFPPSLFGVPSLTTR